MTYRSLVIAGMGSLGHAFLKLAGQVLGRFERVRLTDLRDEALLCHPALMNGFEGLTGDIGDPCFVAGLLDGLPGPILFLNLCADVDSARLRKYLSSHPVAYIDTGASAVSPEQEAGFAATMSYTNQSLHGAYPHLLCQGINPGMVELIARKIMREYPEEERAFDVTVYEIDTLNASLDDGLIAVGWSPPISSKRP